MIRRVDTARTCEHEYHLRKGGVCLADFYHRRAAAVNVPAGPAYPRPRTAALTAQRCRRPATVRRLTR